MRELNLNEKITLKGLLSARGASSSILLRMNMRDAMFLWWRCTGTPITLFGTGKRWRKASNPARDLKHVPLAEYVVGLCRPGEVVTYKTVTVQCDSRFAAIESGKQLLQPSGWERVCLIETRPNPAFALFAWGAK